MAGRRSADADVNSGNSTSVFHAAECLMSNVACTA